MFQPRTHENGGICCAAYNAAGEPIPSASQCDRCTTYFAALGLRHGEQASYPPPSPYAPGLAKLRADLPTPRWPERPVVSPPAPGDYSAPSPSAAGLAKLKGENR